MKPPLNIIKYKLKDSLKGRCLDAATGDGRHLRFMKSYTAIDLNTVVGKYADMNSRLPFPENAFDTVLCSHTLEHVKDVGFTLKELRRVLVAHGRLIVGVPNRKCIHTNFYDKNLWPEHLHVFDKHTLRKVLMANRFRIVDGPYTNYPLGGRILFALFNKTPLRDRWDDVWYACEKK